MRPSRPKPPDRPGPVRRVRPVADGRLQGPINHRRDQRAEERPDPVDMVRVPGPRRQCGTEGTRRVDGGAGQGATHKDVCGEYQANREAVNVPRCARIHRNLQHGEHEKERQNGLDEDPGTGRDPRPEDRRAEDDGLPDISRERRREHQTSEHSADQLYDDVAHGVTQANRSTEQRSEGHGRIDVGARDMCCRGDHDRKNQSVGDRDTEQPHLSAAVGVGADCRSTHEGQHEGSHGLGQQPFAQITGHRSCPPREARSKVAVAGLNQHCPATTLLDQPLDMCNEIVAPAEDTVDLCGA